MAGVPALVAFGLAALTFGGALGGVAAFDGWLLLGPDGHGGLAPWHGSLAGATFVCEGFAPVPPTACVTGPWNYGEFTVLFALPDCGQEAPPAVPVPAAVRSCYVGTLLNELSDGPTKSRFACNIVALQGPLDTSCDIFGSPPSEPFTQRCASDIYATTKEGGVGAWRCIVLTT